MVKKYIEGESKEKRKQRKALEKLAKLDQELGLYDIPYNANPLLKDKYYVLCLKHGTKYNHKYVNNLYNMVKRHCTLDIEFVCLTDNNSNLNPNIKTFALPEFVKGWWCKPYMFSDHIPIKGIVLYMDLDVVISNNIDHLFTYEPDSWCTLRDFTRKMRPNWDKYNSSVIRFRTGQLSHLWTQFKDNQGAIERKNHGDQDWLWEVTHIHNPAKLFPDEWIQSWKWEIRKSKDLRYGMPKGERKLRVIENVVPPKECCICVFHGDPNPHNCEDPWVVDNWK